MTTRVRVDFTFLLFLLAIAVALLTFIGSGPARSEADNPAGAIAEPSSLPPVTDAQIPADPPAAAQAIPLSPMMQEVLSYWSEQETRLAVLYERLDATKLEAEALGIQSEVEAILFEAEVQILRIQARHARADGRIEAALRLEAAVEAMMAPPAPVAPSERPAPRPNDR